MFRKKERSNGNEKERFSERFSERFNLVIPCVNAT